MIHRSVNGMGPSTQWTITQRWEVMRCWYRNKSLCAHSPLAWVLLYFSEQRVLHQAMTSENILLFNGKSPALPCSGDGSVWSPPCGALFRWRTRWQTREGVSCVTGVFSGPEPSGGSSCDNRGALETETRLLSLRGV